MAETISTNTTAAGLRAAADLIDQHPDLPVPMVTGYTSGNVDVDWLIQHDKDQRDTMLRIRRTIGGTWEKSPVSGYYQLRRRIGDLTLIVTADREQVCERVVVGTQTVTVPAVEAQPERTEEIEIVEWRCEPIGDEAVK